MDESKIAALFQGSVVAYLNLLQNTLKLLKGKVVIFHDDDLDGWMAAVGMFVLIRMNATIKPIFYPVSHRDPKAAAALYQQQSMTADDIVIVLDHAAELDNWREVFEHPGKVFWIDHHPYERVEVDHNKIFCLIDTKLSTSGLVEELLRQQIQTSSRSMQAFLFALNLADLYDRWRFNDGSVAEINKELARYQASGFYGSVVSKQNFVAEFENVEPETSVEDIVFNFNDILSKMSIRGETLYESDTGTSETLSKLASRHTLTLKSETTEQNYQVAVVFHSTIGSLIGEAVLKLDGVDLAVIIMSVGQNKCSVSLRSLNEQAQTVAKHFGGGGHPNAAGFRTSLSELHETFLSHLSDPA